MNKIRAYGFLAFVVGLVGVLATYQNCTGTRSRSADLNVSLSQVDTYAQDIECTYDGSVGDSNSISAIDNLNNIAAADGSQLFFGEAPSSMGSIDVVAPLDYATLRDDGGGTPLQVYAFFALSTTGTASLVIAVADTTATTATATATASSTPATSNQIIVQKLVRARAVANPVRRDSTTSVSCTSSTNVLGLTTTIAAQNDGTSGLQTADFSDSSFDMELNLRGTTTLHIHSDDVQDGGLQDTIQLQVYEEDPTTGDDSNYLGDINLTQPD